MPHSTIIAQKTIFKSKLFKVVQDSVKLPNGKKSIYNDVYVDPSVFIFPVTEKNEIYLIYEYRYLLEKTVLQAVAGFNNKGEKAIQTAKRELKEEAGLAASQWEELLRINTENSVIKSQKYLFLARELEIVEKKLEEDEEIQLVKMSIPEAINKVFSGEISGAGTIIGIFLLDKLKREKKI